MNKLKRTAIKLFNKSNTLQYKDKYNLVYPNEQSKYGLSVPKVVFEYSNISFPRFKAKTFPLIFGSKRGITKSYKALKKNNFVGKEVMSDTDFEEIVSYSKSLGVHQVGVTNVLPSRIFSNHAIVYDNAILFTMEMRKEQINLAPSKETGHEVHRTYNELTKIVNKVADKLRALGYHSQANSPLGGDVNFVHLALDANMGAVGCHGLLISNDIGPRQRIAAVFTDAKLNSDKYRSKEDYSWIKDICLKCKKCIRECPANAIVEDALENNLTTMVDYKKCAIPFANECGCSVCIKECIFHQMNPQEVKKRLKRSGDRNN